MLILPLEVSAKSEREEIAVGGLGVECGCAICTAPCSLSTSSRRCLLAKLWTLVGIQLSTVPKGHFFVPKALLVFVYMLLNKQCCHQAVLKLRSIVAFL